MALDRFVSIGVALLVSALNICTPLASAEPLRVGVSIPLTGMAAGYGSAFQSGLAFFEEENAQSKDTVRFFVDDSEYNGPKVVSGIQKLAAVDKVDFILVWGATPSDVAAPVAERNKIPILTQGFDSVAKDRPYVASLMAPLSDYVGLTKQMAEEKKWTKMGVLITNIGATVAFVDLLRKAVPTVAFEEVVAADLNDFNSVVLKIKNKGADFILASLTPDQYLQLAKALTVQRYKPYIIAGDQLGDESLRIALRPVTTGISYFGGYVDPEFAARYRKRYGNSSRLSDAAAGYSLGVYAQAIAQQAGARRGADLIAALPEMKIPATPMGPVVFQSTPETGVAAYIKPSIQSE